MTETNTIKLTQYSHGAGCGCKIAPNVLETILTTQQHTIPDPNLLVGNDTRDDAAVYDLGDGTAILSTTDFFMPIVDDPVDFGRIAAVNAISDIYAMGGKPLMAIAILGWPIDKLPAEVAQQVLEGGRIACKEANIPLAGGHSIDSPEPIFGLAVTGQVNISNLRRNGGALPGNKLFLTKPLGVGILSTAMKKGNLQTEHAHIARDSMVQLNSVGEIFAKQPYVKAMTDVTGFGLLGHLVEMCQASRTSAKLTYNQIPRIEEAIPYLEQGNIPGGTKRNWKSYGHHIGTLTDLQRDLLCDPQTSGGLLMAVVPEYEREFVQFAQGLGMSLQAFGEMVEQTEVLVEVR